MNIWFSPLEQFEVNPFISINFLGLHIFFTNTSLYAFLVMSATFALHIAAINSSRILPNSWSIVLETSYSSILLLVKEQIGHKNEVYLPFIYTLFWFILGANLFGNVPYSYALTTSGIASMGISVMIFIGVTITGFSLHSTKFFSFFLPAGTPLAIVPMLVVVEFISYIARAFSLGIRLFSNIVAGHTLLKILSSMIWSVMSSGLIIFIISFIPISIFIALIGLEIAVSFIQAYVFVILTCSYINDAINLH